jgi:hypothetical protein
MSRFEDLRGRGKALADRATEAFRGSATDLTDQAIKAAVDQGLRILSVASDQVREKNPAGPPVTLGVGVGLGLFYLEMHVQATPGGPTTEPTLALRPAPVAPEADKPIQESDHELL